MKSISVHIHPDGTITVAPSGYKGTKCKEATKFLEEALGLNTDKRRKTPDWFQFDAVKGTVKH